MPDFKAYIRQHLPSLNLPPAQEHEIIEELAAQMESAYDEAITSGHTEAQALERAKAQIPNWRQAAQDLRAATGAPEKPNLFTGLTTDSKLAFRLLTRQPAFTATIVFTLAIGLGACVAIYSFLESVVLRSLPFKDPARLVQIWEHQVQRGRKDNVVSPANFRDWQDRSQSFEAMSAFTITKRTLTNQGEPVDLNVQVATINHLDVLGVQPTIGRNFRPEEIKADSSRYVLLSHALWQGRFGANSNILGQKILLGGDPFEVIGVLPASYPIMGNPIDILAPFYLDPAADYRANSGRYLMSVGRLKSNYNADQAQAELKSIAAKLEQEHPGFNTNWSVNVVPLNLEYSKNVRTGLWILMAATGLVLLIACVNVANLLLVRAASREREMSIRGSLGASPWQLARQLLIESLALSLTSGICGCAIAYGIIEALKFFGPTGVPRLQEATLNPTVLAFALAVTLATGFLFSLAPIVNILRKDLAGGLKDGARGVMGTVTGERSRAALVVAEIALAVVLLTGSGLLIQSFRSLLATDPGFNTANLMTFEVGIPTARYREPQQRTAFYQKWLDRARQLPGVSSAGLITWAPPSQGMGTRFRALSQPEPAPGQSPAGEVRIVFPGYHETLRFPLRLGRLLNDADNQANAPLRIVVNESLVRRLFPNSNPLGEKLKVNMGNDNPAEIIGVIADARINGLADEPRPQIYVPHAQLAMNFATLILRTETRDLASLTQPVLQIVREIDPLLPVTEIRTMEARIGRSLATQSFLASLLTGLSALAFLMALVGVYGLMSYAVEQRTHEFGVRLALGAAPTQVQSKVVLRGLLLGAIGTAAGTAAALAASRILKSLPYEVATDNPFTYVLAASLLIAAALLAAYLPARRITRIDPLTALRYE